MTGQQLKNSILQMAVQGKLVPQDPNDEPASVLLERIRAEKEKLIKEGKIKKEKNPSVIFRGADNLPYEKVGKNEPVCIADEVPFEIPDSWEWVRLGNIFQHNTGKALNSSNHAGKLMEYITTSNLYWDHFAIDKLRSMLFTDAEIEKCTATKGDLLVCEGGDIGRAAIWNFDYDIRIQNHIHRLRAYLPVCTEYFYHLFYLYKHAGWIGGKGIGIQGLSSNALHAVLFPFPPLEEQKRIVEKIVELQPYLNRYEEASSNVEKLNLEFPDQLKKSILQYAVQGKLVPQDPNDEPASVLLERIRAEKEQLIKAGKIKRDKHESVIVRRDNSYYEKHGLEEVCINEEIPFEVPSSWALIRLNDIGIYRKGPFGSSLTKSMFVPKGADTVKVYEQKNAIQKDHTLGTYYITRQYYETKMKSFTVEPGDILVSCAGTIGETYVLPEQIELGIINQALMRMTIYAPIDLDYFLLYFDYVLKQTAKESSKGSAIKNIPPFEIFKKLILPLPPLDEQKRIVKKVHELESICNLLCP